MPGGMTTYGPPFGLPDRAMPVPDRGFSRVNCQIPDSEKLPHQLYPWMYQAPGFESFDLQGVVATPTVAAGETTVITLPVPIGWDGVIHRIGHGYIGGGGWQEGDTRLTWRILINGNQPQKNYGAMTTSFGSIGHPRDIAGIVVLAGQQILYRVINTDNILAGGTSIWACFSGYFWRSQGEKYGA